MNGRHQSRTVPSQNLPLDVHHAQVSVYTATAKIRFHHFIQNYAKNGIQIGIPFLQQKYCLDHTSVYGGCVQIVHMNGGQHLGIVHSEAQVVLYVMVEPCIAMVGIRFSP